MLRRGPEPGLAGRIAVGNIKEGFLMVSLSLVFRARSIMPKKVDKAKKAFLAEGTTYRKEQEWAKTWLIYQPC